MLIGTQPVAGPTDQSGLLIVAALLAISSGLASGISGLYQPDAWLRTGRLLVGILLTSLFLIAVGELAAPAILAHPAMGGWSYLKGILPLLIATAVATRLCLLLVRRHGFLRHRLLFIPGEGPTSEILDWLREDASFEVVGATHVGPSFGACLRATRPWAVIAERPGQLTAEVRHEITRERVPLLSAQQLQERRLGRLDLSALRPGWIAAARGYRETAPERWARRALDILASGFLLALTLPLLAVVALAIKLDSPGPVFYRQERVGLGGRRFMLLKLRSMRTDAETGGAARWAVKGDPRVTRVGRLIRLLRIDEVPQVLNVLRGDMAFVGPRPERPAFVSQLEALIPHYADRAVVKPGITGWAQVNYPYGASVEDARKKLTYDLYYVKRRSLFLDLLIIVATVRVVLFQEGSR